MPDLVKGRVIEWIVFDISRSGNPICRCGSWDRDVVVITDDDSKFKQFDKIEFVIVREMGDHYQALLKGQAPIAKPNYRSPPTIPIHHDGKYGESVGNTRPESHAMNSLDDRY